MDTKAADMLYDTIKAFFKKKTSSYDSVATVTRIEGNTAWVHIPGGVPETPVKLTVSARPGDLVQIRVSGSKAWITGNASAPPTDDTVAKEAAKGVGIIRKSVKAVGDAVDKVGRIAGNTAQYFWHTETGEDTGVHITEKPRDEFLQDPDNGGGNLLARSNGIAIRSGLMELAQFFADGIDFVNEHAMSIFKVGKREMLGRRIFWSAYDGTTPFEVTLPWTIVEVTQILGYSDGDIAEYIYDDDGYFTFNDNILTINADGCEVLDNADVDEIEIHYNASGFAPIFSFGTNKDVQYWGNFSVGFGENNTAGGETSAAFGDSNKAYGTNAFTANQDNTADATNSMAVGRGNKVTKENGFACGRYSDPAKNALFAVGNGTVSSKRNAFYVDDDGNIRSRGSVIASTTSNNGDGYICYHRGSIQSGDVNCGNVGAGSYKDFTVTFSPVFSSTPVVVVGFHSASTGVGMGSLSVTSHSESTSGFTIRVFNNDSTGREPRVHWIAVG